MKLPDDWTPMSANDARERLAHPVPPTMGAADSAAWIEARMVLHGDSADEIRAAIESAL